MSSTLCHACLEIFREWERRGSEPREITSEHFLRHPHLTTKSLINSARSCHMCFLLLRPDYDIRGDRDAIPYANQIRMNLLASGVYAMTLREDGAYRVGVSSFSRALHGLKLSQEEAARPMKSASHHTDSKSNKLLAQSWFENCLRDHESCRVVTQDYQLPTRLIDIRTRPRLIQWTKKSKPRLVLSTELPSNTPYATPSHCWGKLESTKLRKNNLKGFQRHLPMRKLCKSFLESFDMARRFGLQYIWIDSLCIIQDDAADWDTESLLMSQVYGFSKLNIAAAGAKDGTKGLFFSRNPLLVEKFRTTLQFPSAGELPITTEWSLGRLHHYCVRRSPLGLRTWAFQERFLAPRTLHFGEMQLFWQCKKLQACETYPEQLSPWNFETRAESGVDVSAIEEGMPLAQTWGYIVASFTRASLTFPDDKLVAISGVAKLVAKKYGATYVCGLWKEELVDQLLWFSQYPNKRTDTYRAPSWSWASLDGLIGDSFFHVSDLPHVITIIDVQVFPEGPSIHGKIERAFIQLGCLPLLPYCPEMSSLTWTARGIYSFMDEEEGLTEGNLRVLRDNCYYLRIRGGQKDGHTIGLLVQATNAEQGQYRRVGHFCLDKKGDQWLQTAQRAPERMAESSLYEQGPWVAGDGEIRAIISLV